VLGICDEAGIKVAYLPPYSPDLNPIEEAFAELKAWCRKHYKDAETMSFEAFLEHAMLNQKNGARGHFSKSRVGIPVRDGDENDYYVD
jgi:transposase